MFKLYALSAYGFFYRRIGVESMTTNQPIRIAQIIGKWVGGGVEAVVMNYYRHTDRTKIQFDFICDNDSTNIPYDEIEKLGGKVILIPPYQKVFKYHKELKRVLKEGKYRIVHSHINTLSVFSLFAAKCAKVPVRIAHSHSTTNKKEKTKNLMKQCLRPFSKLFATDYMCCSELAGRWLFGNKAYNQGKVYLLTNAIDLDKFKYNEIIRNKIRKELGIKDSTLVIGHVGRFVEQKNHDFLVDVFEEIHKKEKDSLLVLVGQGPLEEKVKDKVNKLGIEDFVKFLGQRNDVNELYQAFDVFCLPSLYEGLGMVAIEAQCANCFCIVSDNVPAEAKIGENIAFCSLHSMDTWINNALNFECASLNEEKIVSQYDIKKTGGILNNYYLEKAKLKICHIVSGLKSGGVETMIYNYCSPMKDEFEFHLIYQHEGVKKNIDEFESINFKLKKIPSKAKHPIKNYYQTYKYLKENKIDIVHAHMTLTNFIPLFAAKFLHIKVRISHSHNSDTRNKNILVKILESIMKCMTNKVANIRLACGEDAGLYLYSNRKFITINNALNVNDFLFDSVKRKEIRDKFNLKDSDILLGHIGRFTNQKNHMFLIEIMKEVLKINSNVYLVCIGDGELREQIQKKSEEENIAEHVIFTGVVSNAKDYYSAFDVFVLPSLWEGLPVVGIEAQLSGVPCLFSDRISKKIIITNNSKLISIKNSKEWVDKILSAKIETRKIDLERFNDLGYNINIEYKKLEKIYMEGELK